MSNVFAVITAWCVAHPLVVMLAWPAFSAVVTWIFRQHSEDEYAKLPAWAGHVLRFIAALGIDSGSVLAAFAKLFGMGKPPSPPGAGPYRTPDGPPKTDEVVPPMAAKSTLRERLCRPGYVAFANYAFAVGMLGTFALSFVAEGCKGLTPGQVSNIENVVNTVEQDACILATDFAPNADAQTIAEVCGFVQPGTQIAEDVINHILQILESKKRSKDPALKAKYAARLAAHKPDAGAK